MNKIKFSLLTLLLFLPLFIYAQPISGPKDCCKLRTRVDLGSHGSCDKDKIVASNENSAQDCGVEYSSADFPGVHYQYTINICTTGPIWPMFCFADAIQFTTNWIFYILTIIVTLMAIYGGFNIVTSAGDPKKMETGRKILTFALIGLVVALIAKFLPYVIIFFVAR
jgi:hypothetical protein